MDKGQNHCMVVKKDPPLSSHLEQPNFGGGRVNKMDWVD